MRTALTTLLLLAMLPARSAVSPGLYFDPAHDGHGFDLQAAGEHWTLVFYSYAENGQPEWFLGILEETAPGVLEGALDRYGYDPDRSPPQQVIEQAGSARLLIDASCDDDARSVTFDWALRGKAATWCTRPLLAQDGEASQDFTGLWYAGEDDAGWGLSMDFQSGDAGEAQVHVLFYYDAVGDPRWALGLAPGGATPASVELFNFRGYCRTCPPVDRSASPAGTLDLALNVVDGWPGGELRLDGHYALGAGGEWDREGDLHPLSDPAPGLIPLPPSTRPSVRWSLPT